MIRIVLLFLTLYPALLFGQDARRFAKALDQRNTRALDRWMVHYFHVEKHGRQVYTSSGSYTVHHPTYDSLQHWLEHQPGLLAAGWDRCVEKLAIWPGYSRFGVVVRMPSGIVERCYHLQEGRPGSVKVFGWRAPLRKNRELLTVTGNSMCAGFVEEQRRNCELLP